MGRETLCVELQDANSVTLVLQDMLIVGAKPDILLA